MTRLIFIFLIILTNLLLEVSKVGAQPTNLGTPTVINYSKKEIKSGTQTWDVATSGNGFTYFANNSGLVIFDGYHWENHPLPNQTVVRSVAIGPKGEIYVGGQGDFGIFTPSNSGKLQYTSLLSKMEKHTDFEDVWDIIVREEGVFFRTTTHVFKYDYDDKVDIVMTSNSSLLFMGLFGNTLVVQNDNNQLYEYIHNTFTLKRFNNTFDKGIISSVINYLQDTILITTIDNGIFYASQYGYLKWATNYDEYFHKNTIYCASPMSDGQLAIGTSFDGVIILDKHRRILHHLNKSAGLQNNTVLSTTIAKDGNIWVGLDNGISLIDINAPFRHYFPDGNLEGTGYAAKLYNGNLYFGTNTGLYSIPWQKHYQPNEKNEAKMVGGTKGQIWSLNTVGTQLLVGHHNGAFAIDKNGTKKITSLEGVWKFVPITDELIIGGYYKGLAMFALKKGTWTLQYQIKGFEESARIIAKDRKNNIWIAHPYRGVYTISNKDILNHAVKPIKYSLHNSFGKVFKNEFYSIGNTILLNDGVDLFQYNPDNDKVELYTNLRDYLPNNEDLKFLLNDEYKNIWYGTQHETALLVPEKSFNLSFAKYIINDITGLLPNSFESVYTIDEHNVIFPTEKGFLFFNPLKYTQDTSTVRIVLSKVIMNSTVDSVLYSGYCGLQKEANAIKLRYSENNISFYFTVQSSGKKEFTSYSYLLDGVNKKWSMWSTDSKIAFTGLPSGSYTLFVKAKNHMGKESEPYKVHIAIGNPWYRTMVAYLIYIGGLGMFIYIVLKRQKEKHETEKLILLEDNQRREKEHLVNEEASREEITRLQNEKLVAELNFKNQELTSFTYHLANKNELITEITEVVNKLELKLADQPEIKKELKQITKLTEQNSNIDTDWENFIKSFDQVHTNFYKRLNEEFKDLSPNDYKLCTYLRMNLTSKEIAALMNISTRSVETNRYRLRKKLSLDSDTNLNQFLINY